MALRAGVDLNITYEPAYMGLLIQSVQDGSVPMALVDRAARRVVEQLTSSMRCRSCIRTSINWR